VEPLTISRSPGRHTRPRQCDAGLIGSTNSAHDSIPYLHHPSSLRSASPAEGAALGELRRDPRDAPSRHALHGGRFVQLGAPRLATAASWEQMDFVQQRRTARLCWPGRGCQACRVAGRSPTYVKALEIVEQPSAVTLLRSRSSSASRACTVPLPFRAA
jgi:hypothetical protein